MTQPHASLTPHTSVNSTTPQTPQPPQPWCALMIANRGEIARRVARSARALGLRVVAVYHEEEAGEPWISELDEAYSLGAGSLSDTYLNIDLLIKIALQAGVDAVHPGYGFLAESAEFARACERAGLCFVGPPAEVIELMADKRLARQAAQEAGLACAPGYEGEDQSTARLLKEGEEVGVPLMVKAALGGGGRGLRRVTELSELHQALTEAQQEATLAFGEGGLLLERLIEGARHVEVQVFADDHGGVVHLGERECSLQRRQQKIIEESPCRALSEVQRASLCEAAVALTRRVGYRGAGTIEHLLTPEGEVFFLEMNTRLQVEHPVTELRFGVDLVAWQLKVAMGEPLPLTQEALNARLKSGHHPQHAVEARLYAEAPHEGYAPRAGRVLAWRPPSVDLARVDEAVGRKVSPLFDPMLAKVICTGDSPHEAYRKLTRSLDELILLGVESNLAQLRMLSVSEALWRGDTHTRLLDDALSTPHDTPLAPPQPRPPSPELLALAAVALSTPHISEGLEEEGHGVSAPLAFDGWGTSTRSCWTVRLAPLHASLQVEHIKVTQLSALCFEVRVMNAENTLVFWVERPTFNPKMALLSALISSQISSQNSSPTRCTSRAHISRGERGRGGALFLLSEEGHSYAWRDVSYELSQRGNREAELSAEGFDALKAPVAGRVRALLCEEGAHVTPHQPLLVIEAMKLEHTLYAPHEGVITHLSAHQGQLVSSGEPLLTLSKTPSHTPSHTPSSGANT